MSIFSFYLLILTNFGIGMYFTIRDLHTKNESNQKNFSPPPPHRKTKKQAKMDYFYFFFNFPNILGNRLPFLVKAQDWKGRKFVNCCVVCFFLIFQIFLFKCCKNANIKKSINVILNDSLHTL
jgi:hypothetical protein